jgi:hypothetical protein
VFYSAPPPPKKKYENNNSTIESISLNKSSIILLTE